MTLSVEELMPLWLRRRFIVGERIIKPNRKLKMFERVWYEGLGFYRFDDLDNITNALNPPMVIVILYYCYYWYCCYYCYYYCYYWYYNFIRPYGNVYIVESSLMDTIEYKGHSLYGHYKPPYKGQV